MTAADLIRTRFTAESTAAEVVADTDLRGRRAVVTGGSSGIGIETARALASAGAEVTLAVRDTAAGERVAARIVSDDPAARVSVLELDLARPASVHAFASSWYGPLHILVNNAGIMATPLSLTERGWEMQFATNHVGHFALATGLRSALSLAQGARIVAVSSAGHFFSPVVFDDIHFDRRPYDPWSAYGQSKTANILFAVAASSRWADDGIAANSLMPGNIHTRLQRYVPTEQMAQMAAGAEWKSAAQGAATSVFLACSPLLEGVGGRYFVDCNEAEVSDRSATTVASYAVDPEQADRLWEVSSELLDDS
jgi:NAD(P)-dependent dehydrogenase (short-subunit alcohol dehydrogenase family)